MPIHRSVYYGLAAVAAIIGIPGGLWLGSIALLNLVPEPPAVVEGRYRRRLYQEGAITKAEFHNPALLRQRIEHEARERAAKETRVVEQARRWDETRAQASEKEKKKMDWEIEGHRGRRGAEDPNVK